jgi:hypothetical protein
MLWRGLKLWKGWKKMDDKKLRMSFISFVKQYKIALEILQNAVEELESMSEEIIQKSSDFDEKEVGEDL